MVRSWVISFSEAICWCTQVHDLVWYVTHLEEYLCLRAPRSPLFLSGPVHTLVGSSFSR